MNDPRSKDQIIENIETLTQQSGFIYILALILQRDMFLDPAKAADINWHDHLSFQELSLLIGLMVKHKIDISVLPVENIVDEQIGKVYELFQELHLAHNQPFMDKFKATTEQYPQDQMQEAYKDFFGGAEMMAEPIFYGGSGAYDFQYLEFAAKKYAQDENWLISNKGISVKLMVGMAKRLKKLEIETLRGSAKPKSFQELYRLCLKIFCFNKKDLAEFPSDAVENFIKAFSLSPGGINEKLDSFGAYNMLDSHPIVILGDDLFFLPVGFNLPKSIYESPFYWMGADNSYKDQAFEHRGKATEEFAYEMLEGVFGKGKVFKNVKIQKNGHDLTDIDVLAIGGNKAVIIQAKSKKLTELSKKGDNQQILKDFEEAVQKAYDQGLVSRTTLKDSTNILIKDDGSKLNLVEPIDDAYLICLTSDHYPAVTHQTSVYLRKNPDDPYPLPMSLFDLDMVSFYLKDPFEFLYYLRQRIRTSEYYHASSEATLLGAHLKQKLYPRPDIDGEALDETFAQLIDANFPVLRGDHPKTKAVERLHHKWKNEKFDQLVEQIKSANDSGFTDALFYLFDMAGEGADDLIDMMEKTKQKSWQDRQMHDFAMTYDIGNSGITFVCLPDLPDSPEKLESRLMYIAMARKYKSKADTWLGLGSIANSPRIVDAVAFNNDPWVEDEELARMSKTLGQGIELNSKGKKIGRNEKCPCGSGKKWKKCHGK